jgi:AAA domain
MASVAARGGRGKTAFTRSLLLHAAAERPFLGEEFDGPLISVYFTREGSAPFWRAKIAKGVRQLGLGEEVQDRIHVVQRGGDCGLRLSRPADVEEARRVLAALKAGPGLDLVVFDPFSRFMEGNENESSDMSRAVDAILELQREFEVATFDPHHASQSGKGLDAFRGHTTFEGALATGFVLTVPESDSTARTLEIPRARYSESAEDTRTRHLSFDEEGDFYVESDESRLRTKTDQLLALLDDGDWHKANDIAEALGVSRSTVRDGYIDPAFLAGKAEKDKGENGALIVRRKPSDEQLWESS